MTKGVKNVAAILAGGTGSRMGGDLPKQFLPLAGRLVLERAVDAFDSHPLIDEVAIVTNPDFLAETEEFVAKNSWKKVTKILKGGRERYDSTLSAIRAYAGESGVRLILHDAVRPLVSSRIITDTVKALDEHRAVVVAYPVSDTIIVKSGEFVGEIPERRNLLMNQTPQAFELQLIEEAFRRGLKDPDFKVTDDCGVVLRYMPDVPIFVVRGESSNIKLTYPEDLRLAELLLKQREN